MTEPEILETLKRQLKINDILQDEDLMDYIAEAIEVLTEKLNIKGVLIDKYPRLVIKFAKLRYGYENSGNMNGGVKSMSQGQRSITYKDSAEILKEMASDLPKPFVGFY
jgi:hypothetical protein